MAMDQNDLLQRMLAARLTPNQVPAGPQSQSGPMPLGMASMIGGPGSAASYAQNAERMVAQQQPAPGKFAQATGKVDQFLGSPGGGMIMNLLAQQGYSTMPQSKLGAVGRAGLMTIEQQRMKRQEQMQKDLYESEIAKNNAAANPYAPGKSLTELAKLEEDYKAGRIDDETYRARKQELTSKSANVIFDQEQTLQNKYATQTQVPRVALLSISQAESLLANMQPDDPNALGQLAALISAIKSLDGSTVREGELAAFMSATGLAGRIEAELAKAQGKGLGPTMIGQTRDMLARLRGNIEGVLDRTRTYYERYAKDKGLDAEWVTGLPNPKGPGAGSNPMIAAPGVTAPPPAPGSGKVVGEI